VYVAEFLASDDGVIMARLVTGIHDDKRLQQIFVERYGGIAFAAASVP
jgi:hypothetical protein